MTEKMRRIMTARVSEQTYALFRAKCLREDKPVSKALRALIQANLIQK